MRRIQVHVDEHIYRLARQKAYKMACRCPL